MLRRQSDLSLLSALSVPGIESVRNTETVQDYGLNLRCGKPTGIRVLAIAGYSAGETAIHSAKFRTTAVSTTGPASLTIIRYWEIYSDWLAQPRDVSGSFGRPLQGRGRLPSRQARAHRAAGYRSDPRGRSQYRLQPPRSRRQRDAGFTGITWSARAIATPTSQLRLTADLARTLDPSLGAEAVYVRNTAYGLTADYALTPRTTLTLSGRQNKRQFAGATSVYSPLLRDDRLTQMSAGLQYKASPRLKLALEGGHEKRNANGMFFDYGNTYIQLSTALTFGTQ